jgi:Leucine-rich repeat (LRR) protein
MKNLYTLTLVLLCAFVGKAQIINIPDAAFKAKLLSASPTNYIASTQTPVYSVDDGLSHWSASSYSKIDTNNDGEIQVSEASNISCINVSGTYWISGNIVDMTGIEFFSNLIALNCSRNTITNLNVNGLINLQLLECGNNQLSSLNVSSMANLQYLGFCGNHLPNLNISGLTNLKYLNCYGNQVSSLNVSDMTNLLHLDCGGNLLTSLDVSSLTNLQFLNCNGNQLPSLNVSNLINLYLLDCQHNQLPSLNVSGLTQLAYLYCDDNQIPSLNLSGLTNLIELYCSNNQIPSLNLSGMTNLWQLYCYNNHISNLDLSDAAFLGDLYCDNNQLTTLLLKNGSNETYLGFSGNPNLQYICADEGQIPDVQSKITQYGYTNCHVNSYCSFKPGGTFYTIQGANRFDENNNGCDVNDSFLPSVKLNFASGGVSGGLIPDASGNYQFDVQDGTHTFTPVFENPGYFNISPASAAVTFPTTASPFVQDFCVTANGVHPDLEVVLIPITRARPGFDAFYKLYYKNKGNTIQSGNIALTFNDAVLDLILANPSVSTQALNTLTWNFSNLVPLATGEIVFTLNVNSPMETPAVIGGDVLSFMANINPISGDETTSDNTFAYNQTVLNSFDPNDKVCLEGDNIAPEKVGDYVHYIIRFENDGTANAENIGLT